MGFLGSIGSFLGGAAKVVATGGLSVIAPKLIPKPINTALNTLVKAQFPTSLTDLTRTGIALATKNPALLLPALPAKVPDPRFAPRTDLKFISQGGQPMGLDIGGILGAVGNLFGGVSAVPAVQGFGGVLTQLAPAFSPTFATGPLTQMPQVIPAGSRQMVPRGTSLTQDVFNAGAKVLGQLGIPYAATAGSFSSALRRTLGSIGSLARRTPAGTIVSILLGLGLTAYESNLLVAWHSQRKRGRRMNPANSKALHRAARRIKRFHKLCTATDVLRGSRRRGSTSRYCGTCKKNPCRC